MNNYKLYIFDIDNTVTTTKSGETFRQNAADWQWLPGRLERLAQLKQEGARIAFASNQGGVAFGYLSQIVLLRELGKMCQEAGINIGALYVCYTHPKATRAEYRAEDHRRKPGPGMLLEAMNDFDATPQETLMVGDRPEDLQAAHAAWVDFMWADDFFEGETLDVLVKHLLRPPRK